MKPWTEEELSDMRHWEKDHVLQAQKEGWCYLCCDDRIVCPGCTRGMIQLRFDELFTSCGFDMRCPECVGYKQAAKDYNMIQMMLGREQRITDAEVEKKLSSID